MITNIHEIAVAVDAAAAAAVDDAAAADCLVSGNGGPPVQLVKGPLDTKPPPFKNYLNPTGAESAPYASRLAVPAFRPDNRRHALRAPGPHESPTKCKLGATSFILHQI